MTTPLQQLGERGQSVWLDFISRDLLTSGELQRLIAEDNVTGMTSNPTIFQKAIAEGSMYDDQIRELIAAGVDDPKDVFTELAITRHPARGGHPPPRPRPDVGRRRVREPRGAAVTVARHRRDGRDGANAVGAGRPSQPHDQDSGDARGHAGNRPDHRRRAQRQRDAHLRASRCTSGSSSSTSARSRRGTTLASRSTCTRSRRSSSAASTRSSTSCSRQSSLPTRAMR